MWKYLRYAVIVLTCVAQFVLFSGCYAKDSKEAVPMSNVQIPDTRIPELTPSEAAEFINQYSISSELKATDKTLEILSRLDVWPDKMCEFVLLLQAEQVPDEIYGKLANIFLFDLNNDQMARFL